MNIVEFLHYYVKKKNSLFEETTTSSLNQNNLSFFLFASFSSTRCTFAFSHQPPIPPKNRPP